MLKIQRDIRSLTDFKRNTTEYVRQLKKTGQPLVLTVNGRAELVVQDASSYQQLMELVDRLEAIDGIQLGLEQSRRGLGRPFREALEEIRKKVEAPSAE